MEGVSQVSLVDVREVAPLARQVIAAFERDWAAELEDVEVHHIGATSLPFGHTKGDVDVNIRVGSDRFAALVHTLAGRLVVAQPENWTETFASFATDAYALPLGVQITVTDSPDDFLLRLRDQMREDPTLLRRYDDAKLAAADRGADAYWMAKDRLLREVLT
jgi:GrpB-like predicted nucleotidyltransferase (UPF0157 family)